MGKYKKLFSDTLLFAVSNFSSKFLLFLLLPLYTGVLSTAEYGYIDAVYTLISLAIPVITLCIYEATLRFALDDDTNKKILFSSSLFVLCLGIIFSAICCMAYAALTHESLVRVFLIFLLFFFNATYLLITQFVRGTQKLRIYALGGIILTFSTVIFNIVFLVMFRLKVDGYILATIMGYVISIVFVWKFSNLSSFVICNVNFKLLRNMLKYSIPLIPNTISWWINYSLDKYMIISFCGLSENGLYSVASKFPAILTTITDIFFKAWQISSAVEYNSSDRDEYYKKVCYAFISILLIMSGVMLLLVKLFAKIFISDIFFISWKMMPFLIIAVVFSSLSGFIGSICTAAKQTSILFKSTLIGAVVNIIFNLILIKPFGGIGAAISTSISFAVIAIIRNLALSEIRRLHLLDIKVVLGLVLIIIEGILCYCNLSVGYRAFILILILILNGKELLAFLRVISSLLRNRKRG